MTTSETVFDEIVVGAGMAGLCLAKSLSLSKSVVILEKSRSVGGRMATRRDGDATYDHGAQFYKSPLNEVAALEQLLTDKGILNTWFQKDKFKYQATANGITTIAKQLSQNLNIFFNEKILSLSETSDGFVNLHSESNKTYKAQNVYLSAPLPQSLEILKASKISYPQVLESILYAKALVGLFEVESASPPILNFSYDEISEGPIFSLSNQQSKGVSEKLAWTVVMSPEWSEDHFEENEEDILKEIIHLFSQFLKNKTDDFKIIKYQLKKWRYSHPLKTHTAPFERVGVSKNIFLLGDAFGGGSLSGAIRSSTSVFDYYVNMKERGLK